METAGFYLSKSSQLELNLTASKLVNYTGLEKSQKLLVPRGNVYSLTSCC